MARGDEDAFVAVYRGYLPLVLRWSLRETRNRELAADLTAEVFAAALTAARRYRPERGSVAAWLLGIARNKLAESRRRGRIEDSARRRLRLEPWSLTDCGPGAGRRAGEPRRAGSRAARAAARRDARRRCGGGWCRSSPTSRSRLSCAARRPSSDNTSAEVCGACARSWRSDERLLRPRRAIAAGRCPGAPAHALVRPAALAAERAPPWSRSRSSWGAERRWRPRARCAREARSAPKSRRCPRKRKGP